MNKEMFNDVFVFAFSEPGAMGVGGYIDCITDKTERFSICYLSDETPWSEVKKCFPVLKECCFNGPMKNRPSSMQEIVIHLDDKNMDKETKVALGWKHMYMGFGNHLVIREDHYKGYSEHLKDLTEEKDIYGEWHNRAMAYIKELQGNGDICCLQGEDVNG